MNLAPRDRETRAKVRLGQSLLLPDLDFRIPMPAGVKPPADAAERDGKRAGASSDSKGKLESQSSVPNGP
jgi:hypothetical protein